MTGFPQLSSFRGGNGIVRLIGHRGARGIMPENTMAGFEFTVGIGVEALEFDVVLTRDRIAVVTHNHHLLNSATRDSEGAWLQGAEPKVAEMTLAEIQALDVGGLDGRTVYGQRFPDQAFLNGIHVPRLTDLLEFAGKPENSDLHLMLELKSDPDAKNNRQEQREVAATVIADVRAHDLELRTILHSFDWNLLDECRRQAPEMPTSYLSQLPESADDPGEDCALSIGPDFRKLQTSIPQAVFDAGGQLWCPHFMDLSPELVSEAHGLGLLVSTWTVNEITDIEDIIALGVDGIISDYPGRVQHCLLNRRLQWSPGARKPRCGD